MAISVTCGGCGRTFSVKDEWAGRAGKCPACGARITVPMPAVDLVEEPAAASAPPPPPQARPAAPPMPPRPQAPPSPAPPAMPQRPAAPVYGGGGLTTMKCQSCSGTVEYRSGQGYFECQYCHSRYNSTTDSAGGAVVQTLELRELRRSVDRVGNEMEVSRLQEKGGNIQDKIDFSFVEFHHSFPRKAGSAGVVLWIVGAILAVIGLANAREAGALIPVGLAVVGLGLALFFLVFRKAKARFDAEVARMKAEELEPVYQQLRNCGAQLAGGNVSLGYVESIKTPLRYCVSCHQNVQPAKGGKGGGGTLSGMNLALTLLTCGAWLPAWIFIAVLMKAGGSARRASTTGACPMCGTLPLFPARIKNV